MEKYSLANRLLHWSIFLAFCVLVYTEIMNQYFFSKEAILKSFEFSLNSLGYEIPPLDQLFIARLTRRTGWMWHYYAGYIFTALVIIRFFIFLFTKNKRYIALHVTIFILVIVQVVTGISLGAYEHIYEWQNITRKIHHFTVYLFYAVVFLHFVQILIVEQKKRGTISKMIGGNFQCQE